MHLGEESGLRPIWSLGQMLKAVERSLFLKVFFLQQCALVGSF